MTKYIQFIPKPLLEDILNNRCIPIIGAGFSLNCELPKGKKMPLWEDLGKSFSEDLIDYPYSNALDAISAYSFEYSRSKLVEKLSQLLFVADSKPSNVHKSFCRVPFDIVCTTNFDFLLEKGYDNVGKYCLPIMDEEQLSIGSNQLINYYKNVLLLKLHGDLHHPNRIVATEQDYDSFLENFPLISTYLANLLITRTPLFIGYSLEDADFRQVWQIISNRLGELRRPAYVLSVGAKHAAVNRYKRRGVNVININAKSYAEVFETLFEEIREYWIENLPSKSFVFNEQTLAELSLPVDATNRLCYVAVPYSSISLYRSYIFPIIEDYGFSPVSSDELVMQGDNITARETALIERADMIIFDAEDDKSLNEIRNILEKRQKPLYLLVLSSKTANGFDTKLNGNHNIRFVDRNIYLNNIESEEFTNVIEEWLTQVSENIMIDLTNEPERLLGKQEYKAAVISAFTLLESELRKLFDGNTVGTTIKRIKVFNRHIPMSILALLNLAVENGVLDEVSKSDVEKWVSLRNKLVHGQEHVISQRDASKMVRSVNQLIGNLKQAASTSE
ncbi:SIR2 family NAD-dependent protein deacylase [Metabacillus sediminilitoris]|uniref:SIR2 family protein n=1 Tax=Metabacillus sediminilitoris TaxID=2567941 RepID=A0A4S4BWB3_9BACI|nr:SIR2 family protein [Metabacillus sediminilitoris]QGQ44752.1 SIR2 family protein [Metabacillus sediminilitoris]THF78900.1 SIR2 family protein [Metabacillus sediminilitoris]